MAESRTAAWEDEFSDRYVRVTDENLAMVTGADPGVLVLSKTDCGGCIGYEREIKDAISAGRLEGATIGKMLLDLPGSRRFKRENPWVSGLQFLPYTVVYERGRRVDEFAATRGEYLIERLEDAGLVNRPPP